MPRRANQAGQEMMKDLFLVEQRSADHIILSCVPAKRREKNGADQDLSREPGADGAHDRRRAGRRAEESV